MLKGSVISVSNTSKITSNKIFVVTENCETYFSFYLFRLFLLIFSTPHSLLHITVFPGLRYFVPDNQAKIIREFDLPSKIQLFTVKSQVKFHMI